MINSIDLLLLLVGIFIGAAISIALNRAQNRLLRKTLGREIENTFKARAEAERSRIVRIYEGKLLKLKEQQRDAVVTARRESTNQSRAVLKGKMAEQIAPMLPGFDYWGYSACKDHLDDCSHFEVVIMDIKQGKSRLTYGQRQIAQAVSEGRVRFEVVRVHADGSIHTQTWGTRPGKEQDVATGAYIVRDINE